MAKFRTLDDLDPKGKRVLLRADLNVPMKDGKVGDLTRIERLAPTIRELAERGARVVVMSHFGRPKGKPEAAYSLRPLVAPLAEAIGRPVAFAEDCVGPSAERAAAALKPGDVALLENLSFHAEEEKNDPAFARRLAALGDLYVNDAFGTAHRAHASTEGVAHDLPAYAGFLMERELNFLGGALEHPKRPLVAIVGGAKVSDKIIVLDRLLDLADAVLVGGGMANTFFKANGLEMRDSLVEDHKLDEARRLMAKARETGKRFI